MLLLGKHEGFLQFYDFLYACSTRFIDLNFLLSQLLGLWAQGWLVTKLSKNKKTVRSPALVAIDCEMVLCEDGTEALVRVCVVDRNLQVRNENLHGL